MRRARWLLSALMIGLVLAPSAARAATMGVDIWTDRGKDGVYEPGEPVQVKVRASHDAYLLVYDIDSEGYVRVLYPYQGGSGYVEGRTTYRIPPPESGLELIVQNPVGQGFIVAVISSQPFNALPWYLRPYDPQAESAGYVTDEGEGEDEEGTDVTSEGRIVGDPFVAMERIRRRILYDPADPGAFATAYTSYYVHQPVRYPRYLCDDCHRPRHWAWWDGWDPYYSTCSAFDFRVYWGWAWGPRYWFGTLPYYCYVPRCYPCSPYDRPWYSSWHGRGDWGRLWGGQLVRHKSPPPPGYQPPASYDWSRWRGDRPLPPGLLPAQQVTGPRGERRWVVDRSGRDLPGSGGRPGVSRNPGTRGGNEGGVRTMRPGSDRARGPGSVQSAPRSRPRESGRVREAPSRPTPSYERPRQERGASPSPSRERSREEARPTPSRTPDPPSREAQPTPTRSSPEARPAPSHGGADRGASGERRGWR